ncbi:MAG: site-specific DNA-methyltransferase [Candidatus Bathyarchaeota archaeon]|nr:site-specific DNA-methyltransferase [Candidatus Bathyarchaeota archaeon]
MAKDNLSELSKEQLIDEIKRLKKRKKYGIVWENKPEEVAELCKKKLPIFVEDKEKEINTDKEAPVNILIEGDNYHALSVLNYTHKGKVDVIYIDPPYNTGNGDSFIYNDKIVDNNDGYNHSKWLSFISKRLNLAKNLLSKKGIIFISIDDTEVSQLKLLCDEIFGEKNFIANVLWKKKTNANNIGFIPPVHDFILVYSRTNRPKITDLPISDEYIKSVYKNPNNDPKGFWKTMDLSANHKGPYFPIKNPKTGKDYYPPKGRYWVFNEEEIKRRIKEGLIIFGTSGKGAPVQKKYLNEAKLTVKPDTWWDKVAQNSEGTTEIAEILGPKKFVHPKPKNLIKHILRLSGDADSIILDFFAGSGTTAHAVLELNDEDKGNRKFILCTNNENDICSEVCYPRIKNVVEGYTSLKRGRVKGSQGHLKYFRTDFVDAEPTDINKKRLVEKSTEMLCLKENCFEDTKIGQDFKLFSNRQRKNLGIIYSEEGIEPFKQEVKALKKKFLVYVFSLDENARDEEFEDVAEFVQLKPIPAVILNVYKRIFNPKRGNSND